MVLLSLPTVLQMSRAAVEHLNAENSGLIIAKAARLRGSVSSGRTPHSVTYAGEAIGYGQWMAERMFVFAPAGAYVAQWLQSFREFPPRQKPASFNLDRVMEEITTGEQNLSN